jgi:hypothetical protein
VDLVRIFRAVISALLVVVFISLLLSAYTNYRTIVSTAQLIDACSSVANRLVLQDLAYVQGSSVREYVVDPSRTAVLPFCLTLGGDNYSYSLTISIFGGENTGFLGPQPPLGRAVASLILPVVVFDNFRFEPGLVEVRTWRT